jgi:hypothetical protein
MGILKSPRTQVITQDNTKFLEAMAQRDERNTTLLAQRQADIMKMEVQRIAMERAATLATKREEAALLATAQSMEDAAQQEATAQAEEADPDNVITGFYGSLLGQMRPD